MHAWLQSVVAFVFMERHWQTVTQRLSTAVTRDIAAIVDMLATYPEDSNYEEIVRIARDRLDLNISIEEGTTLPPPRPKPAPDIVLRACELLGVAVTDAVVVGDSEFDRRAARAAGARFIGFRCRGDRRIEELDELLELVRAWHG